MVFAHIHGYQDKETTEFTYRNILKTMTAAELLSGKPKK